MLLISSSSAFFCSEEPELCSRCDSTAICETNNPLVILPQKLPVSISSLELFYTGPNATLEKSTFSKYVDLKIIVISGKNIISVAEFVFTDLKKLEQLAIRETNIKILPECFLPPSLKVLQLEFNKLTSIPHQVFKTVLLLTNLSLEFNHIQHSNCQTIGNEFKQLSKIQNINLSNFTVEQQCENQIPATFFEPIQGTIKVLNLTYSNIYGGNQTIFKNCRLLEDLDISAAKQYLKCPISARDLFENLPSSIRALSLIRWRDDTPANSECTLTNVTLAGLKRLPHLNVLNTRYSDLLFGATLKKSIFDGFNELSELYLDWCRFSIIEDNIFDGCPNLSYLSLIDNPLGNRPVRLFSSLNQSKLHSLTIASNSIYADFLRNYNVGFYLEVAPIRHLDLSYNQLHRIPTFTIDGSSFDYLEEINLDHNFLTHLKLANNSLFKESCVHLVNLRTLRLNHNQLATVEGLCDSLTHLYLANNQLITRWDYNQKLISNLQSLIVLDISGNEIVYLKKQLFEKMSKLTELYVHNNLISHVELDYVRNNPLLEVLDLRHNFLREINVESIEHLTRLRKLLYDSNSISALDKDFLEHLDSLNFLEEFGLRGNALQCTCTQDFVQIWLRNANYVPVAGKIDCHGPSKKLGVKVYKYKRDYYACDAERYVVGFLGGFFGLIAVVLIVIPIYKYRWYITHIKVVFSAVKNQIFAVHSEHVCLYDAFVVYNSNAVNDAAFVVNRLIPAIENHEKDNKNSKASILLFSLINISKLVQ